MHTRKFLPGIMLFFLVGMVSQCLAQEARIIMPAGVVNAPYSKSIAKVLIDDYGITKPLTDWQLVGPVPVGFDLDRTTGTIFGTSVTAETHLFRVQAFDRSVKRRPIALKFLVSIQIKTGEESSKQSKTKPQAPPESNSTSSPPAIEETNDDGAVDSESSGELQVKHSGLVSNKDEKTYVAIVAGSKVTKISVAAFEKADDGQLTKPLTQIKAPPLTRDKNEYLVEVPLSKSGVTKLTVKDLTPNSKLETSLEIAKLAAADEKKAGKVAEAGDKSDDAATADAKQVIIQRPADKSDDPPTEGSVDVYVKVLRKSGIKKIRYRVENGDNSFTKELPVNPTDDKDEETHFRVRVLEGTNVISVANADDLTKPEHQAEIEYLCKANCASSFKTAEFAGSQNTRAVVGIEQAGASSASSESKPFLDMFFSTPFWFKRCGKKPNPETQKYRDCMSTQAPRMAVWGNVRLGATPEQIAAIGVLPSNFANTFGDPRNTVDLVQSFDFLTGLETRLFTANGHFLSLIPGLPQKTRFYVAGGGGAISPLNARREVAQIFIIPKENSPQRQDFIDRFGTPPTSDPAKEFVGLVPLDRDRFLRQWYLGLRLKTFYCHNPECTEYENSFPSMVDVMFGQNEAVTGGSLFYLKPDPNDPSRNIKKRSFVLRFDAFYPFPLRRANFLYFYGTAIMKIGAGGVRIQNPLFLDRAADDVQITDSRVYIPPSDLQKMFQPSRDYYKLGVGIDLIGLINRATNDD